MSRPYVFMIVSLFSQQKRYKSLNYVNTPDRLIKEAIAQGLISAETDIKTDIDPSKTDIRQFPSMT